ncbi:MAG TPA: ABC transporter substrate-binding protein [Stellaceae bacterium]|nr:ABC transporter substrate-binding protein [Stellaceae bacterium]
MRSISRLILAAALLAMAVPGDNALAQAKKVIRAVPIGDLKVMDPIWSSAYTSRNHGYMVYDTLFALDAENRPQPQMVDSYAVSDDKLTYTFTLRDGLKWHDGQPVRAADCVASIKRWGAKDGMGRALMQVTGEIAALDDRRFRLVLKKPVGFVIEALGKIDSTVPFMMPERLANTDPNTQVTEVIGSGPFRFVKEEWVPGSKVVYEKFADYVPRREPPSQAAGGKVVKVDRVEMDYLPDASVAANALVKGEVDLLASLSADLVPFLKSSPDVIVTPNDPLGYQLFMVINHLQPPFDKPEARQALLHAVKQSDFLASIDSDPQHWQECPAVFGCGTPNESKAGGEALMHPDLAKAKSLLQAAGYGGEPILVMDPTDNPTLHPPALVAAEMLRGMGAKVDIAAMDWSTLTQRRASKAPVAQGGWNIFITNSTITGIANPLLHTYIGNCDAAWYGWPCDPKIVDLTQQWMFETDTTKRKAIVDELQKLHLQDVSYIPLGQYRNVIAYRKDIKGLIASPALFFWNVEKD